MPDGGRQYFEQHDQKPHQQLKTSRLNWVFGRRSVVLDRVAMNIQSKSDVAVDACVPEDISSTGSTQAESIATRLH